MMSKQVILSFSKGDLSTGFEVKLQIREDKNGNWGDVCQADGALPPSPNIDRLLCKWRENFCKKVQQKTSVQNGEGSRGKPGKSKKFCFDKELEEAEKDLTSRINTWLNSGDNPDWRKIRDSIQQHLHKDDDIQVIIQTGDIRLWQVPWQGWSLFAKDYPKTEIALSPAEGQSPKTSPPSTRVRILAVLGKSDEIDIDFDRKMIDGLCSNGAEVEFLTKPSKEELLKRLWDKNGWDIFFFAGHSETQNNEIGLLHLSEKESLEINGFKNSLRTAIQNGLQLAIFNSCDGLGLANQLSKLHLPQSIVMREPIPDIVAQKFLQDFLSAFSSGSAFYASVREARDKMEEFWNKEYPGIAWLPVICQNPTVKQQPLWDDLRGPSDFFSKIKSIYRVRQFLKKAIIPMIVMLLLSISAYYLIQNHTLQKFYCKVVSRITPSPKTGDWTESLTCMEFVWVAGGYYEMECDNSLSKSQPCLGGFWMGKYEVTQGQWKKIMDDNPSAFKDCGDNCPVEMVSWEDVQNFIVKLNDTTGENFRLPNETEWEYACRSRGKIDKYAGGDHPESLAWYGNSEGSPQPVGEKHPNGLGIYDMSGNVWEWCEDSSDIVIRGGAWGYPLQDIRCDSRLNSPSGIPTHDIGFRLIRSDKNVP